MVTEGRIGWPTDPRAGYDALYPPVKVELVVGPTLPPEVSWRTEAAGEPWIMWRSLLDNGDMPEPIADVGGMLDDFIALADRPPEYFLEYVRKWGPLNLCEHWRPVPEGGEPASDGCQSAMGMRDGGVVPVVPSGFHGWEPIAATRYYARLFRTTIVLGNELIAGRVGLWEDWKTIFENWGTLPVRSEEEWHINNQRYSINRIYLSMTVSSMLNHSPVRLIMRWRKESLRPHLVPSADQFATLALQLAHAVTQAEFSAVCSYCHRPYPPVRKPAAGRNQYCRTCGPARAKLDYKKRKREVKRQGDGSETEVQSP